MLAELKGPSVKLDEPRNEVANWADDFDELSRQQVERNLRKTFGASIWSRNAPAELPESGTANSGGPDELR